MGRDCAEVDILVNNAGDIPGGTIETVDEAKWRQAWELKVYGFINLARELKIDGGDNATLASVGEFLLEGLYVNNRLSKYNNRGKAFFRK